MVGGVGGVSARTYTLDAAAALPNVPLSREALRQRLAAGRIVGEKDEGGRWLLDADRFDAMVANRELRRLRDSPRHAVHGTTTQERRANAGTDDVRWALAEQRVQSLEAEVRRLRRLVSDLTRAIDRSAADDELDGPLQ
jgi:hypothetical protein